MLGVFLLVMFARILALGYVVGASDTKLVRLVDSGKNCSGRVEVYRSHQWGTICGRGWDLRDADVVCRELGCGRAVSAFTTTMFGRGVGVIWLRDMQCTGDEEELSQCHSHSFWNSKDEHSCSHRDDAGTECSGPLERPVLSLLSPQSVFYPGEAVRFSCMAPPSPYHITDFYLYRRGGVVSHTFASPQMRTELVVFNMEMPHQGSYSCVYKVQGRVRSPPSNSVNITVVELNTPEIWYNVSLDAPPGSVIRGHSFNVTCSTQSLYPGGSFQLRIIRSNGTVRQSVPAFTPSVTFTFPSAQTSHEGYYCCLYRVQLGGRVFTSRESQPLPIILREPKPILSAMEVSWLVSAVTFAVAVLVIILVVRGLCKRKGTPMELERGSRTCVENTYVVVPVK
ncbi:uncharacterized protein si:ch211-150o23.3 [Megalops cyprinoides]|uniref:uncharacterized protein si:ch211-150o23.3 n=1 Tax=Megalops cyprinoides TaxID=118141 RepID=UPI001864F4A7|nr:uncharacterized protein si:ch211-150o23.3 [Megalops cyprinoides]